MLAKCKQFSFSFFREGLTFKLHAVFWDVGLPNVSSAT